MRPVLIALFVVLLLGACSSSGKNDLIVASDYDQKCSQDSDCIAVAVGEDGCCGLAECDNAAINVSSDAQYQADVGTRREVCDPQVPCPAVICAPYSAVCSKGVCAVGAQENTPADAG
jgi:hypothetical protein